jgi:hypothetical protein
VSENNLLQQLGWSPELIAAFNQARAALPPLERILQGTGERVEGQVTGTAGQLRVTGSLAATTNLIVIG